MVGQPIVVVSSGFYTKGETITEIHIEETVIAVTIVGLQRRRHPSSDIFDLIPIGVYRIHMSRSKVFRMPTGCLYSTLPRADHAVIG